jgi:PqqD family protein of HPr-rel-A system
VIEAETDPEPRTGATLFSSRFVATDGIRILKFGDESVVFNPMSWDAHLLNAAAVEVLDLLTRGPRPFDDVVVFLGETLVEAERADASEHTQRLLHEFEQLGLVHRLKEESLAGG